MHRCNVSIFRDVHVAEALAVPEVVLLQRAPHDVRVQPQAAVQVGGAALGHAGHVEVGQAAQAALFLGLLQPAGVLGVGQVVLRLLPPTHFTTCTPHNEGEQGAVARRQFIMMTTTTMMMLIATTLTITMLEMTGDSLVDDGDRDRDDDNDHGNEDGDDHDDDSDNDDKEEKDSRYESLRHQQGVLTDT